MFGTGKAAQDMQSHSVNTLEHVKSMIVPVAKDIKGINIDEPSSDDRYMQDMRIVDGWSELWSAMYVSTFSANTVFQILFL